jgi:dienelactone hydrolase
VIGLLLVAAAFAGSGAGGDRFAGWRQPPPAPAEGFVTLPPLLTDASGRAIETAVAWQRRRKELARVWQTLLGPFPDRVPLRPEVRTTTEAPDHTRLLLRYRNEKGVTNEAHLLLPKDGREKHPGMVVLHQTTERTIDEPVGIAGREPMHVALHLVRRGYVCIVPRCFLWGYGGTTDLRAATERLLATPPWKTGMAKMVWDGMRALDLLETRTEVDRTRIGCIGHSLGGKTALYLGAFDARVAATVSCEGGVGLAFSNWHDPWYLGAQIKEPIFTRDHHEIIALIAPRPFLLIGGSFTNDAEEANPRTESAIAARNRTASAPSAKGADGPQSWPYVAANLPVYRLLGAEARISLQLTGQGHDFPHAGPEREKSLAWLDHWLKHTPPTPR